MKLIEAEYNISQVETKPIEIHFMAHVRLMFLFSQIYIKMKENIDKNAEEYESYWTKEDRMTNLS